MTDTTPKAIDDCHELLRWIIPQLDKFPRQRRFTLGERIETGLLEVLEALTAAAYSRDKRADLDLANRRINSVRHLWRLAYELKAIASRTHAAVDRYQAYARRYAYVLKLDVRQYFASIDHAILKEQLGRRIEDRPTLRLLDTIIIDGSPLPPSEPPFFFAGDDLFTPLERPRGIPIGNLTSQFFAKLYLDDLDHWIKETLRVPGYVRYVDDLLLLADDKAYLWDCCAAIEQRLETLRLKSHPRKRQVYRATDWVDVLGYRVRPDRRRLRNDNGHRFRRCLIRLARDYGKGMIGWSRVNASVQSWIGHARHADTEGLRRALFRAVTFQRERTPVRPPGETGRVVEQQTGQRSGREPQQERSH